MTVIDFPGLGLHFEIDKIALRLPIFTGGIRWYAIFILTGILLGAVVAIGEYKKKGGDPDHFYNLLLWGMPVSIITARLYYVIFSLDSYRENPTDIFKIWEGGIAIYGAIIGAAIVLVMYCRKRKLSIPFHCDFIAFGFMIGQIIGRWGNFVNGEAYGRPTDLPWRMIVNGVVAHPTFLYESLWNLVGFIIIWSFRNKNSFDGKSACFYLIWYGLGRAWIELLRTDSLMLGSMRVSTLLSVVITVTGLVSFFIIRRSQNKKLN